MKLNTKFSPSQVVYWENDKVIIDGIHIRRDGTYVYHVRNFDGTRPKGSVFILTEDKLSIEKTKKE